MDHARAVLPGEAEERLGREVPRRVGGGRALEPLQRLVNQHDPLLRLLIGNLHVVDIHIFGPGSALEAQFPAGAVHENLTHRLRRGPEEMSAVLPHLLIAIEQFEPGFVDQRGGLQSLTIKAAQRYAARASVGKCLLVSFRSMFRMREEILSNIVLNSFSGLTDNK